MTSNLKLAVIFEVENGELKSRLLETDQAIEAVGKAGKTAANDLDRATGATDRLGRELAQAEQAMGRTRAESGRTSRGLTEQSRATDQVARSSDRTTAVLGQMRTALAGVGIALGVREVVQYADGWTLANNRLRLASQSSGELAAVQAVLFDASQRTRSSFESTVILYTRMYQATRDLAVGSDELVQVVTTIQQAFRVSGASAQEAENAIIQLSQGLASGTLRGDEFNSIMEQAPRLAQAMSEALNVTRGELREMAAAGEISAEMIINALKSQGEAIATEFGTVNATIGDSLTTASNALQKWVGQTDEANGTSRKLAGAITLASENMDVLVTSAIAGVGALTALNAAGRMTAMVGGIRGATGAMATFNAVARANPILLLASVAATAVAAFITLGDESDDTAGSMRSLGEAIGLTTEQLDEGAVAIDAYVERLQGLTPAQLKAAKDAAVASLGRLTEELQDELLNLLDVARNGARGAIPNSELNALVGPIEAIVEAGKDLSTVQAEIAKLAATFESMGQSDLAQQIRDHLGAVTEGSQEYEKLRLVMLSIEAQADIMSGVMAGSGTAAQTAAERSAAAARKQERAWRDAWRGIAEAERAALDAQRESDDEHRQRLASLRALIPAVQAATEAYNPLTRQYELIDRGARLAARTDEIFREQLFTNMDRAVEKAKAEIDEQDRLTRAREEGAARVAAANARMAESLELQGLKEQRQALAAATIEWDELAGAFVVVDRQARIAEKALELLRSGATGSRAEAEAVAASHVDTADAIDRERQAREKLAAARTRDRELSREIDQMKAVTAAIGRATVEYYALAGSYRLNTREARILERIQDELNRNSSIGADRARELAEKWVDASDAQERATASGQKLADTLNDQADAAEEAADTIQDTLGDALSTVFLDGEDAFRRMTDSWKRDAIRAGTDIFTSLARLQIGNALNMPELTRGVSLPGIPGGSIALAGMAGSNLLGGNNGLISGGLGIAGGLFNGFGNSFGSSALSYGLSSAPQTAVNLGLGTATNVGGQLIAAPTALGSSLAGGINSAGYGVIGSAGARLLGFESRNPYVGMGLTTAGSIGGGIAGTAAGAAIGGTLGAAGGPIGAVIGAALGQVLSSYIGAGASVGPNAAGHLSAAGGRFAIGGVGSDNGGDLSGVTQQLSNAASTLNSIMDSLSLTLTDSSQIGWATGLGTGAASPYSARSAEELVSQVLGSGAFSSTDTNVQKVLDSAGGGIDLGTFQASLQFAASFTDQINAWAAASAPAATVTAAATAEMQALQSQIESFRAETERLGLDTATATNVTRQHVEVLFGIREAAEPMGQIATLAAGANARLEASADLLALVGITAEEAAAGVERSIGRMGDALQQSLEAELNAATGRGAFNTISQVLTEAEAVARELTAGGKDTGTLYQLRDVRIAEIVADQSDDLVQQLASAFGGEVATAAATVMSQRAVVASQEVAQTAGARTAERNDLSAEIEAMLHPAAAAIGDVLDRFATLASQASGLGLAMDLSEVRARDLAAAMARLDAEGLQDVILAYPKSAEVLDAATRALAGLSTTAELAAEAEAEASRQRMAAIEDETRALSQAASTWSQIADQLDDARAGLRLAQSAALSPENQLRETEAQYQAALQQALSGDQNAAGQLPELARAMQEAGLAWFGPSSEFYGLQDTIQADLAEAAALAGDQSSIAEQQLAVAEAQLAELQRIAGGGSASSALTDFFALGQSVNAGTATGDTIGQQHSIIDQLGPAQLATALQYTATGGQAQSYIRGQVAGSGQAFDPAADAAAKVAFTDLGRAVSAGTASGDVLAQRDEILSRMGPEALIWALGQVNPEGSAVGPIRGYLHQYGVPGFDAGGRAGAGMVLVGESGPELVNLPRPAEILDAGTSRRWMEGAAAMERGGSDHRVLEMLGSIDAKLARLLSGTMVTGSEQLQTLGAIRDGIGGLANAASRQAARPQPRMPA